jgi:hypothetical protein
MPLDEEANSRPDAPFSKYLTNYEIDDLRWNSKAKDISGGMLSRAMGAIAEAK